jgi:hypothetical protein
MRELWIGGKRREGAGHQGDGPFGIDFPVGEERAPALKKARARPDGASAPGFSAEAVLQADSTTQSALSFSCAASLAVRRLSSNSVGCSGVLLALPRDLARVADPCIAGSNAA